MHRLRRQLKPNIPYNKKFRFSKGGCAVMCSRLFVSAFQKQVTFIAAAFRLEPSREKTGLENPQIFQT